MEDCKAAPALPAHDLVQCLENPRIWSRRRDTEWRKSGADERIRARRTGSADRGSASARAPRRPLAAQRGEDLRLSRLRAAARAQLRRGVTVEAAVGGEDDAIVALGDFARNQTVRDIERNLLGIALGRIAEAAAARQFEPDEIAAGDALPAFGADRLAGDEGHPAQGALAAAVAAASGVADPFEIAQHRDRRAVGAAQLDDLTETAAEPAGPARAFAILAPPEQHRRHRLGRLDRDRPHTAREGGHVEPVLAGPRPGPAAMEDSGAEGLDVGGRTPVLRAQFVENVGTAVDLRDPQGGRALGRHAAFDDLMQAAEHDIGQHMADRVP